MKKFLVRVVVIGAVCGLAAKWLKDNTNIGGLLYDLWYGDDGWDENDDWDGYDDDDEPSADTGNGTNA